MWKAAGLSGMAMRGWFEKPASHRRPSSGISGRRAWFSALYAHFLRQSAGELLHTINRALGQLGRATAAHLKRLWRLPKANWVAGSL